jgi:2-amino-4-hydroxy-6-hydroxymethyldihydropteridine diphosphokinase
MRAGIALGSNIEPRLHYLQAACRRLCDLHTGSEPVLCSPVYETSPVDCPPHSPLFLNAALEFSTELQPPQLLGKLKIIERDLGRSPGPVRNTPRTIDLDLLYCDAITVHDCDLTLPHPRITVRRFVLQPLAEIRPKLVLPNSTKTIEELLTQMESDQTSTIYCGPLC